MDEVRMKRLQKMDSLKSYDLLQMTKQLAGIASKVQETLENSFLREQVIEVVEGFYDLGKVVDVYELFGGFTNRSFRVVVEQNGMSKPYFVRKYKFGITDKEILFEHAMITYVMENGFHLVAGPITGRDNSTFASPAISKNKFALYNYLEGEDKYSWDNPLMEESEHKSAAEVLAQFHNAAMGFKQHGGGRVESGIITLIAEMPALFTYHTMARYQSKFHDYFKSVIDSILLLLRKNTISGEDAEQMIKIPIHCDYHPGNLKFDGGKVVGVFDLDWSKIDFRLLDVCLALLYNSVEWGEGSDGDMDPGRCESFLKAYQSALLTMKGMVPLNDCEIDNFPTMMAMANFYLMSWEVTDYYSESDRNEYEYLAYLKHSVRQMHWIENHKQELQKIARSVKV